MEPGLGLLCVHAHPDDEAIATGGVLARYAGQGLRTAVVTCTNGDRGEIHNMDVEATRPRLADVRREELAESLRLLGAGEPRLLGYRDSGMLGTAGNDDPEAFWRADFDAAVGRLVAQLRAFRPDVLVTYDAFGGYGHPDHVQAHRVALVAAEACAVAALYPQAGAPWRVRKVYLATIPRSAVAAASAELARRGLPSPFGDAVAADEVGFGTPDEQLGAVVDVRAELAIKLAALRAHRSQMDPTSFFLNIPADLEAAFFGVECFMRQRSDVAVDGVEDDLFAGLRP
ncbi:MAG: N-acetyl-1-D-myo-inositol-2-amino-2-deoxy-alpha-D-glucopyranoside deacetylase [Actinomycetota bacterium]|nr:N-acetyl-1-D-myo-inositol-2-amino-2-deoxy-alpha-D-glucopyranoside deacetylase [Actinomycetota bacterium]